MVTIQNDYTFFVSSTFQDFQAERDLLHLKVFPSLNAELASCGLHAAMVDLRWGINTADYDLSIKSNRVLTACLGEIQNCCPCYLIFMGDRYGWIPPADQMSSALLGTGLPESDLSWSVTEMEVQYELFLSSLDKNHTIVCLRDPLDQQLLGESARDYLCNTPKERQALEHLRAFLEASFGDNIIRYSARWDNQSQQLTGLETLQQDLSVRLRQLFAPVVHELQQQDFYQQVQNRSWLQFQNAAAGFTGRTEELETMRRFQQTDGGNFGVYGGRLSGKTALMAQLALKAKASGNDVFVLPCQTTPEVISRQQMQDHIIAFLERCLGLPVHTKVCSILDSDPQHALSARIGELIAMRKSGPPLIFIIDGLDSLLPDVQLQRYEFLPFNFNIRHSGVYFYLSEAEKHGSNSDLNASLSLSAQSGTERIQLIQSFLRAHHKSLDHCVIAAVEQASVDQPVFFMIMLLQRLLLMDGEDLKDCRNDQEINKRMIHIVQDLPRDLDSICIALEKVISNRLDPIFCGHIWDLLNLSIGGFSEEALESIFRAAGWSWRSLYFSELISYADHLIIKKPGNFFTLAYRVNDSSVQAKMVTTLVELIHHNIRNEEILQVAIREGLHLAFLSQNDLFAEELLQIFNENLENISEADLFVSMQKPDLLWLLRILPHEAVSPAVCRSFADHVASFASCFAKDDMDMPTYQAMSIEASILAYRKSGCVTDLKTIIRVTTGIFMSLGAHWMNDWPEALPPFYQLLLSCKRLLLQAGVISCEHYCLNVVSLCPSIAYMQRDNSIAYPMDFIDLPALDSPEVYDCRTIYAIKYLLDAGYRLKTGLLQASEAKVCKSLEDRMAEAPAESPMLVLGKGREKDMTLADLLSRYSAEQTCLVCQFLLSSQPVTRQQLELL